MAAFNYDFSKYKPSSKGGQTLPAPAPVAPKVQTPSPAPAAPAPKISAPAPQAASPKGTFFSGGPVQKIFDVLQAPMFAFSGFLSGAKSSTRGINQEMGFGADTTAINLAQKRKELNKPLTAPEAVRRAKEGFVSGVKNVLPAVRNRQGFGTGEGDFNFGAELSNDRNSQVAANFLTDISVPSLPIGKVLKPVMSAAKALPFADDAGKLVTKAVNFAKETPAVYKAIEKVNPYFRNPEFGKMLSGSERQVAARVSGLFDEISSLAKGLTPEEQKLVTAVVEGRATTASPKILNAAGKVSQMGEDLGREAVELGILSEESFQKFRGKYISHIFDTAKKEGGFGFGKATDVAKVTANQFKKRTGAEGFIEEFAPASFKGLGNEIKDIEVTKFYRDVAQKFGRKIVGGEIPDGYVRASDAGIKGYRFGKSFARIAIPAEIAEYLTRSTEVAPRGFLDKALDVWKAGKTIYNPAYHARNLASNQILSDLSTGEGIPLTTAKYLRSVKNYASGGDEFSRAAKKAGLIGNTNLGAGFGELLEGAGLRSKGKVEGAVSAAAQAPGKFQSFAEDTAKLNVFRTWIERFAKQAGMDVKAALSNKEIVQKAVDKAEEAIFSPYKISKQERNLAGKIFPFYSFTRQSIPFITKKLLNQPNRILKYEKGKKAIEELTNPDAGQGELPPEFRNQIRLPIKDKEGRYKYIDPTYILPWGNLLGEDAGGGGLPFGMSPNPILTTIYNAAVNNDPYFQTKIRKDGDSKEQQLLDTTDYLRKQILPTLPNNIVDKVIPAAMGKPDYKGRERSLPASLLYTLGGIRTTDADPRKLRTQQKINEVYNLRSVKDRKAAIMKDRSLTPEQKKKMLQAF